MKSEAHERFYSQGGLSTASGALSLWQTLLVAAQQRALAELELSRTPPPGSPLWQPSGPNSPSPRQLAEAAADLAVKIAAAAAVVKKSKPPQPPEETAAVAGGLDDRSMASEHVDDVKAKRLDQSSAVCHPTFPPVASGSPPSQEHSLSYMCGQVTSSPEATSPPGEAAAELREARSELERVRAEVAEERRLVQQLQAQRLAHEEDMRHQGVDRRPESKAVLDIEGSMHEGSMHAPETAVALVPTSSLPGDDGSTPPLSPAPSSEGGVWWSGQQGGHAMAHGRVRRRGKRLLPSDATGNSVKAAESSSCLRPTADGRRPVGDAAVSGMRVPTAQCPSCGCSFDAIAPSPVDSPAFAPAVARDVPCQTESMDTCFMCESSRAEADGFRREAGRLQLQHAKVSPDPFPMSISPPSVPDPDLVSLGRDPLPFPLHPFRS